MFFVDGVVKMLTLSRDVNQPPTRSLLRFTYGCLLKKRELRAKHGWFFGSKKGLGVAGLNQHLVAHGRYTNEPLKTRIAR